MEGNPRPPRNPRAQSQKLFETLHSHCCFALTVTKIDPNPQLLLLFLSAYHQHRPKRFKFSLVLV